MSENQSNYKLLSPTRDFVFRTMFRNPENTDLLEDLLKSILDIPEEDYERIEVMDSDLPKEHEDDKQGILDVKIHMKTGKLLDVEVQVRPFLHLEQRSVFYSSKMIVEQIGEGIDYDTIKPVIVIWILDYDYLPEKGYHNISDCRIHSSGRNWPTLQQTHIVELPKVPQESDGSRLWLWAQFFKIRNEDDLERLAKEDAIMSKAVMVVKKLSQDELMQLREERRLKAERDNYDMMLADLDRMRRQGLEEGREQGLRQKAEETAREGLREGLNIELIEKLSGLTKEEIAKLAG